MNIITRKEAKLAGLNKYFTGERCVNGHLAERYTASGSCSECINGKPKGYDKLNSKTLQSLANQTYATALSNYNDALKRITRLYEDMLEQAQEYERKAREAEVKEQNTESVIKALDDLSEARSHLTTTWVVYNDNNRDGHEQYYLSLLQRRCPEFTLKDLRYRNRNKGGVMFQIQCFPEDRQHIDDITSGRIPTPQSSDSHTQRIS